jgi:hypothetical protein
MSGLIDPTDATRIHAVLAIQRDEIVTLHDAVSAARLLASSSTEALNWRSASQRAFATRLAELIDEFDRTGTHLTEALEECDRARRRVDELTATVVPAAGMMPVDG